MPRGCGCDWDVHVFGHAYCWNTPYGLGGGKHVTCQCTTCPCRCHTDGTNPWQAKSQAAKDAHTAASAPAYSAHPPPAGSAATTAPTPSIT